MVHYVIGNTLYKKTKIKEISGRNTKPISNMSKSNIIHIKCWSINKFEGFVQITILWAELKNSFVNLKYSVPII